MFRFSRSSSLRGAISVWVIGALAIVVLTAAGCGSDKTDKVTIDAAGVGGKPGFAPDVISAKKGDKVSMQYVGVLYKDGSEFDASYDRGQPFDFTLGKGEVIKGWDQGIPGMKVGGRRDAAGAWLPAQRPEELRSGVEENLASLGVESLAAVNLRLMDAGAGGATSAPDVPLAEQLGTMEDLRREGKIEAIGISSADRAIATVAGYSGPHSRGMLSELNWRPAESAKTIRSKPNAAATH